MIFDPSTSSHLKPWLVRTLEPICDAEPGALADYILALLKHNVPENEMRNELTVQLEEFLEKECTAFIDTLFTVLRTKSYLPYSAPSPPSFAPKILEADTGIPIPLDGLLSPSSGSFDGSRKRSIDTEERDGPPAKGPRLSTEGQFSRYTNHPGGRGEHRSTGGWGINGYAEGMEMHGADPSVGGGRGIGMNGSKGMNGRRQPTYQPPEQGRGICRDYYNKGYCARGAMCKFSHGEDAVVPDVYPMNGPIPMPFMPMFAGPNHFGFGGLGTAYDPHEARMDMRSMGRPSRAPLLPRIQQPGGSQNPHAPYASGELPVIQDLTPVNPETHQPQSEAPAQVPLQPPTSDQQVPSSLDGHNYFTQDPGVENVSEKPPMDHIQIDARPRANHNVRGQVRRGRGGSFGGEVHSFRPERRNDKTLVVEKIPNDKLSLDQVNEWFKRFGTVTNVAIDASSAKALISFSNHEEAYTAWRSQEAVFGNRFVKVFWHRPMEGHGQLGAKALAASAPLVSSISNKNVPPQPSTTSSNATPKPTVSVSSIAAKQQLLEKQIAEQKSLMASLTTASSEEKKTILARLRKLGEEMKPTSAEAPSKPAPSSDETERERLDQELEMHAVSATSAQEESTEALKAKLEKLKAEAVRLGIPDPGTDTAYGGSYRPYRGRGRSTRVYRGAVRGGNHALRTSMKLDNRPKSLLVKGVSEDKWQALQDWFETTGQMESLAPSQGGDVIISFKSRAAAEQGLSKGNNVPTIGTIQISWYSSKPTGPPAPRVIHATTTSSGAQDAAMKDDAAPRPRELDVPRSPHRHDEEVVTSGWGEDGDGEDGMGML